MNTHARRSRPATYQDVIDAPPNMVAELANGRLHLHPRPARATPAPASAWPDGSTPCSQAARTTPAAGTSRSSRSFTSAPTSWSPTSPAGAASGCLSTPTLRSSPRPRLGLRDPLPSTRRFDLTEKRALYGANGVAHLWLLDPDARTLETFRLAAGAWTLAAAFGEDDEVRAAPFETLTFPLAVLWPDWSE